MVAGDGAFCRFAAGAGFGAWTDVAAVAGAGFGFAAGARRGFPHPGQNLSVGDSFAPQLGHVSKGAGAPQLGQNLLSNSVPQTVHLCICASIQQC